ncbi:hypothetical protein PUN28_016911 [Cardiocondyla obscurior]|uniref:Uncharacterized protein n=1 Tax=Cardiocondyla obscurior TaxID=286306 RepID=A0AAW2EPC4_9HYME
MKKKQKERTKEGRGRSESVIGMDEYLKRKRVAEGGEEEGEITQIRKELKKIDVRKEAEVKGEMEGKILNLIREMREEMKKGIEELKGDNRNLKKDLETMREKEEEWRKEREIMREKLIELEIKVEEGRKECLETKNKVIKLEKIIKERDKTERKKNKIKGEVKEILRKLELDIETEEIKMVKEGKGEKGGVVILKMRNEEDKERTMKKKEKLKGTKIWIQKDRS